MRIRRCIYQPTRSCGFAPERDDLDCALVPAHERGGFSRDSIGRTDLPGGDGKKILVSIREKFLPLPDDTLVIPGHGPTTTMGHEKEFNYFLQRM